MTIKPNKRMALIGEGIAARNALRFFYLVAVITLLGSYIYIFC